MAKAKIIKADDLKLLKVNIIQEIDTAQIQAKLYQEETEQQEKSKQDEDIIQRSRRSQTSWLDRQNILHECLVKIERYTSEIEI